MTEKRVDKDEEADAEAEAQAEADEEEEGSRVAVFIGRQRGDADTHEQTAAVVQGCGAPRVTTTKTAHATVCYFIISNRFLKQFHFVFFLLFFAAYPRV